MVHTMEVHHRLKSRHHTISVLPLHQDTRLPGFGEPLRRRAVPQQSPKASINYDFLLLVLTFGRQFFSGPLKQFERTEQRKSASGKKWTSLLDADTIEAIGEGTASPSIDMRWYSLI